MAARAAEMAAFSGMQHTSGIFSDMTVDGPIIGTLVAIIDRAKNLPNRRAMGKQDPYCAARLGKEAKKTTTDKRGGQTPRWDQELRFTVHDSPDYHRLKVSVFNDDKKTELIGETWVNLESVLTPGGGQSDSWHGLNCKGKYAGDIRIELTYYDTRPKAEKAPVEKKRESTRPDAPTASGPREATPVKRRPLPSDPTRASPSPVHTPEQRGLQGMQSGPREYGSSRRQNEPTPTNQRRSQHPDTPNRRPVPDTSTLTGIPISSHNTPQQQQQHGPPQDPYSTSPNPRLSSSNLAQYREDGFDMSYTAPKPYEVQPVDSQPQHSSNRTMSQDDFRSSRGHSQSHPPEPPHSYSAPIVPTQHTYDPADGYSQDPYQDPSFHVAPLRMNQKFNRSREQIAPHDPYLPPIGQGDPYHGRRLSSMQPTVEDEDDIPPPPPVHRSDASTIPQPVYDDTPAPLNMIRYRSASPQPGYDYEPPQPYGVDDYGMRDHTERRYTNPSSRPVSRGDAMVPSPIRQDTVNIPSSLVAGFDPSRQHRDSVSYQAPPSYETPPRLRQHSEVDYRTPPQYDTPSHAHQLVRHQQLPSTESPNYYPHDPPEQPQRTSPVQETLPLIRPRATSPGMNPAHSPSPADNRMSRIPARTMPTRKSVSPRPQPSPSDTQERRLSGVPFGPDSFDVLNPTVAKPGAAEDERPGSSMEMNESGQIVTFSGRVVDASDHLPVDNWAPEPERKGGEKERPIRTRPQLNGSRDLEAARQREDKYRRDRAERERIRDAANVTFGDSPSNALVTTRHNFSNHSSPANSGTMVLADRDYTPPGSGNRSRLQKRGGRPTSYATPPAEHTSPSHIPMPRSHILRERENPSGFGSNYGYGGNMHSVAAPPVPAKIPLDAGPSPTAQNEDTMALSLELQSIDIGPGSGGRRPRPKQTPRRFGF